MHVLSVLPLLLLQSLTLLYPVLALALPSDPANALALTNDISPLTERQVTWYGQFALHNFEGGCSLFNYGTCGCTGHRGLRNAPDCNHLIKNHLYRGTLCHRNDYFTLDTHNARPQATYASGNCVQVCTLKNPNGNFNDNNRTSCVIAG
ncbi:MAG: hypothetical protein LQ350_004645 [Teloschistes chrysophthalmus]|nr:MAG: hypothetical protein LQ350_004645 [Niorma chrysophthalma]